MHLSGSVGHPMTKMLSASGGLQKIPAFNGHEHQMTRMIGSETAAFIAQRSRYG